jgi:hypothetical protein
VTKVTGVVHLDGTQSSVLDQAERLKPGEAVHHPAHYNSLGADCHACGEQIECIDVIEAMSYNVGAAVKYAWRHGLKPGENADQDLAKAIWYLQRERGRLAALADRERP